MLSVGDFPTPPLLVTSVGNKPKYPRQYGTLHCGNGMEVEKVISSDLRYFAPTEQGNCLGGCPAVSSEVTVIVTTVTLIISETA